MYPSVHHSARRYGGLIFATRIGQLAGPVREPEVATVEHGGTPPADSAQPSFPLFLQAGAAAAAVAAAVVAEGAAAGATGAGGANRIELDFD